MGLNLMAPGTVLQGEPIAQGQMHLFLESWQEANTTLNKKINSKSKIENFATNLEKS